MRGFALTTHRSQRAGTLSSSIPPRPIAAMVALCTSSSRASCCHPKDKSSTTREAGAIGRVPKPSKSARLAACRRPTEVVRACRWCRSPRRQVCCSTPPTTRTCRGAWATARITARGVSASASRTSRPARWSATQSTLTASPRARSPSPGKSYPMTRAMRSSTPRCTCARRRGGLTAPRWQTRALATRVCRRRRVHRCGA